MPPLPSDAEPRPPEDFAGLLATKEPVLLVGGQAVNLWALYYHSHTAKLAAFMEKRLPRALQGFGEPVLACFSEGQRLRTVLRRHQRVQVHEPFSASPRPAPNDTAWRTRKS